MRTQTYDHRSRVKVVSNSDIFDAQAMVRNINPALYENSAVNIKESVREQPEKKEWMRE